MNKILNKKCYLLLLGLSLWSTVGLYAQKMPTIQIGNMKAPVSIKIDGIANEWGNNFKAYNTNNHLQYNIANDEKYLYLIARMDGDGQTIFKAVGGGFIFGILTDNQKQNKLKSITYPAKVNSILYLRFYSFRFLLLHQSIFTPKIGSIKAIFSTWRKF